MIAAARVDDPARLSERFRQLQLPVDEKQIYWRRSDPWKTERIADILKSNWKN